MSEQAEDFHLDRICSDAPPSRIFELVDHLQQALDEDWDNQTKEQRMERIRERKAQREKDGQSKSS